MIELLVVIAIIGMLSALVIVSLNSARGKSRDARRVADIRQIMTAMELYYNDNGAYPDQTSANANPTAGSVGPLSGAAWSTFLSSWPSAPGPADGSCGSGQASTITTSTNGYTYWGRNAADSASATADPAFYQITFCTGGAVGSYTAGELKATPGGIIAN